MDPGDRWSSYSVLDEAGKIILEQEVPTTREAMKPTLGTIPRSLIARETATHSPWVSRLLTELGHEVSVAHAQKAQLITKSNRKDDRHDTRTLARLTVGAGGIAKCPNRPGERGARIGEVLW